MPSIARGEGELWYHEPSKPHATGEADAPARERAPESGTDEPAPVERPFLYLVDPTQPEQLGAVASLSAGYSSSEAATRPLAATRGRSGLVNELRVEAGVHDRIALFATGMLSPAQSSESGARAALNAGLRVLATHPASRTLRLGLSAGWLRDFQETHGGFVDVVASYDIDRLRIASLVHAEKVADPARDQVDLLAVAGASYRVIGELRLGAEYVGQDLEDAWEDEEAEGGVRHFAGATLAWSHEERFLISAGPAVGLSAASPDLLGRASLGYVF